MLVLALMIVLPSHAVLKEKNIENTLSLLRLELTNYRTELERQSGLMKAQQEQVMMNMISVMNRSRQNSLMLYSQKNGFIFDLTYACHEATEQYQEFQKNVKPFRQYLNTADVEISRYDSLINELGTEAIVTPQGTLTSLPSHSGIVPADLTKNLFSLGEIAPNLIATLRNQMPNVSKSNSTNNDNSTNIGTVYATFNADSGFDMNRFMIDLRSAAGNTRHNN